MIHLSRAPAITGAALFFAAPAQAQSEPASGDITVTAQRREEEASRVPIAITVLGGEQIEDEAIANLDRLGTKVPNLYLARNFGTSSGALVFLRGVGEGDSIFTNDPPVGIYVDDVLLPRSTGALLDLIDIERIEVLRGPQGTLYGRNTSGGALRVLTRRPDTTRTGGAADLTLGSYGRFDVRGTVNLPVTPTMAVRLSGISRVQRGWGRNLVDGDRINGQQVQGGRASLLWKPGARVTVFATADLTIDRSGPRFPQRFAADPARPGRLLPAFVAPDGDLDNFLSADTRPLGDTDTGGASLRVDLDLGGATLSSITGYRALRSRIGFDQTATPPGEGNVILLQDQRQHSTSQEVQLTGTAWDGAVDLLAGLYYSGEHNDQLTALSSAVPAGSAGARFRTDDFFVAPSRGAGTSGNWSPYEPRLDTDSYSAYGSATGHLGARATLTAGLRFTDERKRYDVRFLTAPGTVLVLPDGRPARRTLARRWTDVSPRLAADYLVQGTGWQATAYASLAKGFRSGSFDGRARNIDFVLNRQDAIAPEKVWSREVGVKSRLFDRRLTLNIDYFVNSYTDIAFSAARANTIPPDIFRQNVGDARISGLEADWSFRVLPGLELGGWAATLADRFTRLAASPGCTAFVADERQLDLRFTPAFRYQLNASLVRPLGKGQLRLGGEYSGSSPYDIALCNEPQHRVDNAESANARIGYELGDWAVILSATNLTDRRYNSGSVGSIGYPVAPREVQVQVRRRF
ncbi:TonB-dependent receptor [Sphingomonas aracearum]|uniref:TonB-dependent receptor n=1 Tax=Sphingomonas aracearum TaxID=2283317 RepID=A0A369W0K6_9SPHN|nr:TonB-dependent receptor [Sphingomonas aracearum]RDE06890.1 TonB-dependent receptor [Sphingomonas aracearum]